MAGVSVDGRGRGRELNSDVNMIPMIDLLMVTITFLLITAVWSHLSRLQASAKVPGVEPAPIRPEMPKKRLHIDMRSDDRFVLSWKEGETTLTSVDVPRREVVDREGAVRVVRFPDLAERVATEWKTLGLHVAPADAERDEAVLHTGDATPYSSIIAAMDAVSQVQRPFDHGGRARLASAFRVVFAVN